MTVGDLLWHLNQLHPDTKILGWAPIESEPGDMKLSANIEFKLEKVKMFDRGNGVLELIPAKPYPDEKLETVLTINILAVS